MPRSTALLLCVLLPALAQAEIYEWKDNKGQTHFGKQVPAQYRDRAKVKEIGPTNRVNPDEALWPEQKPEARPASAAPAPVAKPKKKKAPKHRSTLPPPSQPVSPTLRAPGAPSTGVTLIPEEQPSTVVPLEQPTSDILPAPGAPTNHTVPAPTAPSPTLAAPDHPNPTALPTP